MARKIRTRKVFTVSGFTKPKGFVLKKFRKKSELNKFVRKTKFRGKPSVKAFKEKI